MKRLTPNNAFLLSTHYTIEFIGKVKHLLTSACLLVPLVFCWSIANGNPLPDLLTYSFSITQTKTIPGSSDSCSGSISSDDKIGDLALVALPYFSDGNCYNYAGYAHANFLTERGAITSSDGLSSFPAFKIHEPTHKATEFLASKHGIYYSFPTSEDYSIYRFEAGVVTKVGEILAANITPSTYMQVLVPDPITVSETSGSVTYVFAPSSENLSAYTQMAPGVEAARIGTSPFGDLSRYRYAASDTPYDTTADFTASPSYWGNRYSDKRRFFLVKKQSGALGVVWQDQDDPSIQLTWFGSDLESPSTVSLPNTSGKQLAAAVGDDQGNVYFLSIHPDINPNKLTPTSAEMTKVNEAGTTLVNLSYDTSKSGLNLYSFSDFANNASLQYANGKLGLILGRTMLQSSDGLTHQGAIGLVINATTLAIDKNWGQTSGHSFESMLSLNGSGDFVGIDLGDNYPRGVHLHKFNASTKYSQLVSTFKTRHGTSPMSPAGATYPEYTEISGSGTTFYQWSNDNDTYTELGGVAETDLGYTVSFVGEPNSSGQLIDNSRALTHLNDARNIGLITVVEDFQTKSTLESMMVTNGPTEVGGFYTFGGTWSAQKNAGIVWLTNYANTTQNASRLKMLKLPDGNLFLIWELWSATNYITTKAMTVTPLGAVVEAETDLGTNIRLSRRGDLWYHQGAIHILSGNKTDPVVELTIIGGGISPLLESWRESHFTAQSVANPSLEATVWGHDADPDGDGSTNLMEYAKGTNPNQANDASEGTSLEVTSVDGSDRLSFVVRKRSAPNDPQLTYIVEVSDNLSEWSPIGTIPSTSGDLGGSFAGFIQATYHDSITISSQTERFVRLRVTYN